MLDKEPLYAVLDGEFFERLLNTRRSVEVYQTTQKLEKEIDKVIMSWRSFKGFNKPAERRVCSFNRGYTKISVMWVAGGQSSIIANLNHPDCPTITFNQNKMFITMDMPDSVRTSAIGKKISNIVEIKGFREEGFGFEELLDGTISDQFKRFGNQVVFKIDRPLKDGKFRVFHERGIKLSEIANYARRYSNYQPY